MADSSGKGWSQKAGRALGGGSSSGGGGGQGQLGAAASLLDRCSLSFLQRSKAYGVLHASAEGLWSQPLGSAAQQQPVCTATASSNNLKTVRSSGTASSGALSLLGLRSPKCVSCSKSPAAAALHAWSGALVALIGSCEHASAAPGARSSEHVWRAARWVAWGGWALSGVTNIPNSISPCYSRTL